ncbi:hypothetical protein D3C80_167970 [compost metagenome]
MLIPHHRIQGLAELLAELRQEGTQDPLAVVSIHPMKAMAFAAAKERFEQLVARVQPVLLAHPCRIAVSFGKDSMLTLAIFVEAYRQLLKAGQAPCAPLLITRADTGIESPVMNMFARRQVSLLNAYLDQEQIPHEIHEATPPDRYSWSVMYLSGLKLITVGASKYADCSAILKVEPLQKVEATLAKRFAGNRIVTVTGVRLSESADRAESIRKYGLDKGVLVEGEDRSLDFAPIVDLDTDEVWMLLRCMGESARREYGSCLPFWDASTWYLQKLYGDQADNCPITASGAMSGGRSGGCSSSLRSGCALCTVVNSDKQAESLSDLPQYPQLANLLAIRNWMSHHFFNMQYRRFIGRKPDEHGYVALHPNTMNERWMTSMLRWCLQADRDEALRAEAFQNALLSDAWRQDTGVMAILNDTDSRMTRAHKAEWLENYVLEMQQPTFQIVTPTQLLMIDAFWSRDGYDIAPFAALKTYHEVYHLGESVAYPTVTGSRYTNSIPASRYVHIERDPELRELAEIDRSQIFASYMADLTALDFAPQGCGTVRKMRMFETQPVRYGDKTGAVFSVWSGEWDEVPAITPTDEDDACGYVIDEEAASFILNEAIGDYVRLHDQFYHGESGLAHRANVTLRRLLSEGVLRLSDNAKRHTARLMARADIYHRHGLTFMADCEDPAMVARTLSEGDYQTAVALLKPEMVVTSELVAPTMHEQLQDLAIALLQIRKLYKNLAQRRALGMVTLQQMGRQFTFDGVAYAAVTDHYGIQLSALRQLCRSPRNLLTLLPVNATLRSEGMSLAVEDHLQQACQQLVAEFNTVLQAGWRVIADTLKGERHGAKEMTLFFVNNRMGFMQDPQAAWQYADQQCRLLAMHQETLAAA